jgi:taurine--2-oxoglutarate transaminase
MKGSSVIDERDGVLHSWCVQDQWQAPTIVGGRGARFWAADGRAWLDMSSLAECSHLGHQHPRLVEAIRSQAEQLCFITNAWGAQPRAELASLLLETAGFEGGRVFFTLGGADANEHAVKFARQARGLVKGWVITRDRSYHGASYAGMALSGDSRTQDQVAAEDFRVSHVPAPYTYRCPWETDHPAVCGERAAQAVAERIDSLGSAEVAAVLMEPNAGTNGIVAPDNYWPALRSLTSARQVLLIADEVMSGFGRCGEWFAWQRYGADQAPDLMSLAKGLTGAHLPLGAVVISSPIAHALQSQMLLTGLTYCGHPLACAAGVAAIRSYQQEGLIERSRHLGQQMFAQLIDLQARHRIIGEVRGGHGLFAVLELVSDRLTRAPLSIWPNMHEGLRRLLQRGFDAGVSFAARGNLLILAPPLVIEEHDLGNALDLLDRLLAQLAQELAADADQREIA